MSGLHLVHAVMSADALPDLAGYTVFDRVPLSFICADTLAALVSILPGDEGDTLFADQEHAAQTALKHHTLLTKLSTAHDLAPVRLGAVYTDPQAVQAMLRAGSTDFLAALARVSGANEFAFKLTPSGETVTQADDAPPASGRSYLQRKAEMAAAQRNSAERARAVVTEIFEAVSSTAREHAFASPRRNAQANQEKRLLDAALLVERAEQPRFETAVLSAQEKAIHAGYRLIVTGPLPPYSFVAIADEQGGFA